MNIEKIKEKVLAAEEKVEKCKKTIERHKAQMEKKGKQLREMGIDPETADRHSFSGWNGTQMNREAYWLLSDYDGKKDDIKGAEEKLADAERILDGWKEKLDLEINKEKIIQDTVPQVIKDFLEDWKEKAFGWYCQRYEEFLVFREELEQEERAVRLEAFQTFPEYADQRERHQRLYGNKEPDNSWLANLWPRKPVEELLKKNRLDYKTKKERLHNFGDQLIFKMLEYQKPDEREAFLAERLEAEKKNKLISMVYAITDITGPITDAKYLYVSAGDLNGVILGEKGVAKLQTFSAGGWNIQCFHYRTRVDDVTGKYKNDPAFVKNNERVCTYQFPRLVGGDTDVARDYGLEIADNSGDTIVRGQYRDILAFADQYLGYQLVPEYLQDVVESPLEEKPSLDSVIHSCEKISKNSQRQTAVAKNEIDREV